jgi:hypothetical protein
MAISQSPTLSKLAARILQQLKGSESEHQSNNTQGLVSHAQQVAAQHGADSSVESLTRLSEDIQANNGASSARRMIH